MREKHQPARRISALVTCPLIGVFFLLTPGVFFLATAGAEIPDPAVLGADDLEAIPTVAIGPSEDDPLIAVPLSPDALPASAGASRPTFFSYLLAQVKKGVLQLVTLEHVSIHGTNRLSPREVRSWISLDRPRYVWELLGSNVERDLRSHPWMEKVHANWDFSWSEIAPTLDISVREAEPWIVVESRGGSWLVSRSGGVLQPLASLNGSPLAIEASEMIRLDGIDSAASAENGRSFEAVRLDYALRVLKMVEQSGGVPFEIERYTLLDCGSLLVTPIDTTYPQVLLRPETPEQASNQLQQLSAVLADLRRRGERAHRIDLRFDTRAILS